MRKAAHKLRTEKVTAACSDASAKALIGYCPLTLPRSYDRAAGNKLTSIQPIQQANCASGQQLLSTSYAKAGDFSA